MTKQMQAAKLSLEIAKQAFLPKSPLSLERLITLDKRLERVENYLRRIVEAGAATIQ